MYQFVVAHEICHSLVLHPEWVNSLKKILKENLNQMKQTYLFVRGGLDN